MQLSPSSISHRLHRWLNIDRRSAPRDQPVQLQRNRIFILPTRYGLLFAVLTFVMLIGSTNYNNSVGFLLTFLLIGLGLVSILHTYRNLAELGFRAGRSEPVFCGDTARYTLYVNNPGDFFRHAIGIEAEGNAVVYHDIAAAADSPIEIEAMTRHRGLRTLGPLTVFSRYPLGLFHAWSCVALEARCVVYPKPSPYAAVPRVPGADGNARAAQSAGSEDFHGFRDFHYGDSPRHVDWKAAARGQKLYTKVFADHEDNELWLNWDDRPEPDIESRLSGLCRGVLDAEDSGLRYGLRMPACCITPDNGPAHRHACLKALALFGETR